MPSRLSARRTFRRIVAVSGALLCASTLPLLSSLPSAAAGTPRASASGSWRIYLDRQWVDAPGLPVAEPASALPAGASLTISSGDATATCTFVADGLACSYGDGGFSVAKGDNYTVTASGLEHFTASNVGTFTTGLDTPGAQCTPNHGGLVDPCRHTVSLAAPAVVVDPAPATPDDTAAPHDASVSAPTTTTTAPAVATSTESATTTTSTPSTGTTATGDTLPGDPTPTTPTDTLTVEPTAAHVPTPDSASFAAVLACILVFVVGVVAFALAVTHRHERPRSAK